MKKFSFRLESLLSLNKHKEEQWRMKLGEVSRRCNRIRTRIQNFHEELQLHTVAATTMESLDMNYYHARERYAQRIRSTIQACEEEYSLADDERERIRAGYRKALQECRAVETIRDRQWKEYQKLRMKADDREIDDIVTSQAAGSGGMSE